MKGLRKIPRILKINRVRDYTISCLFSNGESRMIDFKKFFEQRKIGKNHPARRLMQDLKEFQKVEIIGNTIGWKNVGIGAKDIDGKEQFYYYDLGPIVLYEHSEPDATYSLGIGEMIRAERKKAGLTQQQLAEKSGTSKHYISRLENNKSDIELLTLKKIIEAGFGKDLKIHID